jgi:hypothetical protein
LKFAAHIAFVQGPEVKQHHVQRRPVWCIRCAAVIARVVQHGRIIVLGEQAREGWHEHKRIEGSVLAVQLGQASELMVDEFVVVIFLDPFPKISDQEIFPTQL